MRKWMAVPGSILLCGLAAGALLGQSGTGGTAPATEVKALYEKMACGECHGMDGKTPSWDSFPIIAGQKPKYTYLVLKAYKTGERQGVMSNQHAEVSELLSDDDMRRLADYVATLK